MSTVTVSLADLPPEHPLRTTPLSQIGAEYQWENTKTPAYWHRVTKNSTTANVAFNDLDEKWAGYRWRAKQ